MKPSDPRAMAIVGVVVVAALVERFLFQEQVDDGWPIAALFGVFPALGILSKGITVGRLMLVTAMYAILFGMVAYMQT
jgi:hypothetical protein